MKKSIQLAIFVVLSLCACWFAGQQMKAVRLAHQEKSDEHETDVWSLAEHMDSANVTIEGKAESNDYPYGYNVGAIEDEQVGRAILLTPGTEIGWEGTVSETASLNMGFFLHPWVADGSDGALLNVIITAGGTEHDHVFEVGADLQEEVLSLGEFAGEVRIELAVSNAEGWNTDCDWVILKQCSFSEGDFQGK